MLRPITNINTSLNEEARWLYTELIKLQIWFHAKSHNNCLMRLFNRKISLSTDLGHSMKLFRKVHLMRLLTETLHQPFNETLKFH